MPPSTLAPDVLEKLRRGIPLRMTRPGDFEFGGEPVTHARTIAALRASLDVTPEGEFTTALGPQWCYLQVDDTPLRITTVDLDRSSPAPMARLDDGRTLPLDLGSVWEEPQRGLVASVPAQPSGRPLPARFTNRAQLELSALLTWDDGTPILTWGPTRIPVHSTPPMPRSE